jgi:hypothetical protein
VMPKLTTPGNVTMRALTRFSKLTIISSAGADSATAHD